MKDDNGYKVIELRNGQKMTKEEQNVWDRGALFRSYYYYYYSVRVLIDSTVCSKFFQTMAKSQANYAIKSIGIVVNTKLKRAYDKKKKVFASLPIPEYYLC